MPNQNCLDGIRCPQCGNEDRFFIGCRALADVTDSGADVRGDLEWDYDSVAVCPACDKKGRLRGFRKPEPLPLDPERMNNRRASWAATAIAAFRLETGTDAEDALSDLLADLMHWCDRCGTPFDAELERARSHYQAETQEEPT